MAIYKFIELENLEVIQKKLYNFMVSNTDVLDSKTSWTPADIVDIISEVPELEASLKKFTDLPLEKFAFVHRRPGSDEVHIDTQFGTRLLLPILNCQGSYTRFYDLNGNSITKEVAPSGFTYDKVGTDFPLIEIDRLELTKPVFFNTEGIPHGVVTPQETRGSRISCVCTFNGDASHLLAD